MKWPGSSLEEPPLESPEPPSTVGKPPSTSKTPSGPICKLDELDKSKTVASSEYYKCWAVARICVGFHGFGVRLVVRANSP